MAKTRPLAWAFTFAAVSGLVAASTGAESTRLPSFSWDRVPLYMHVRKSTQFTEAEIRYLAGFPLITFEKTFEF